MKTCLIDRIPVTMTRIQAHHGGFVRRPLPVRLISCPLRSVSRPAGLEPSPVGQPQLKKEEEEKGDNQEKEPEAVNVEATPVVALVAQPATSEARTAGEDAAGAAAEAPPAPASHPLEDVLKEEEEDIIGSKELVREVMDGSAFGKRGEQWLFAQLAVVAMLLFPPLMLKGLVDFCATVALTAGLVSFITAVVNLGRNLSPLPEPRKKHSLVVSGIYGYVRHPMYGGLLLAAFGLAVLTRNETRIALVALLWWVLEKQLAREESALSARYPEYAEYKAKVKKFFPFIY